MIPQKCTDKVLAMGGNDNIRRAFSEMFTAISDEGEMQQLPSATLVIPFYDEACNLQPGDWAPEVHLVVRKIDNVKTEDADLSSGDQVDDQGAEEGEA